MKLRAKYVAFAVLASLVAAGAVLFFLLPQQVPPPLPPEAKASIPAIEEAINSGKPFVIFFSSPGCPACQLQKPVWHEVAGAYADEAIFLYVEYNQTTSKAFVEYDVLRVPTLIFVKDKRILESHVGYMDRNLLINAVERLLG